MHIFQFVRGIYTLIHTHINTSTRKTHSKKKWSASWELSLRGREPLLVLLHYLRLAGTRRGRAHVGAGSWRGWACCWRIADAFAWLGSCRVCNWMWIVSGVLARRGFYNDAAAGAAENLCECAVQKKTGELCASQAKRVCAWERKRVKERERGEEGGWENDVLLRRHSLSRCNGATAHCGGNFNAGHSNCNGH